jgi:SseB protein N-terminal domain
MLPIDPGDGQGRYLPGGRRSPVPPEGAPDGQSRHGIGPAAGPAQPLPDVSPARPLRDIVPAQAMAHGGTIIRPGAVAWGGLRDPRDSRYSSGESIERILASAIADPGQLPALLAELAGTRLWVPLPVRHRPFTDGSAVRLPLIGYAETDADFVPCFTSVQRLTRWADEVEAEARSEADARGGNSRSDDVADEFRFAGSGRQWQRAGDARVVPHVTVPAAGLARRLPAGLGLALNPNSAPGLPLYPECVSYLARLDQRGKATIGLDHPPTEPLALLKEARARLRRLRSVRSASRAWLSVPDRGEGLVIAVALDDPASGPAHQAVIGALVAAVASVPLHVPYPVDVTFAGEPAANEILGDPEPGGGAPSGDIIAEWISRNTRPFYTRD